MFGMPIWTHIFGIVENRRFSSIILPVVCVYTNISLVIIFPVRTPNCFKMKDIKIHVWLKLFYQFYWELSLLMSEWTELPVFTFLEVFKVRRTKLSLVFVRMIKFLNSIVSFITTVSVRALLMIFNIPTFFWLVVSKRSSPIFFIIMIIWTFL